MNPPFVRSVGGNLLFGSLPEYREEMKEELSERMSATNLPGSVTADLGSVFTAIRRGIVVAKEAQGPDHGLNTLGNLGNVG